MRHNRCPGGSAWPERTLHTRECLFSIPLDEEKYHALYISVLSKYEQHIEKPFFCKDGIWYEMDSIIAQNPVAVSPGCKMMLMDEN